MLDLVFVPPKKAFQEAEGEVQCSRCHLRHTGVCFAWFQPTVKNQQGKIELGTIPGTFESVRQSVSDSETGVEL